MTTKAGDTLQRQIERGEVFFGSSNAALSALTYVHIKTGAEDISFKWDAVCPGTVYIILYDDTTTSFDGTESPSINMDFRSSNTIDTVVYTGPTITGLGAQLLRYEILDGIPIEGPLTRESGPILLANKSYIIGIFNNDIVGLTVQYNWFLREV